jgi:hypothetical protein
VHLVERQITRQRQAPPDPRLGATQLDGQGEHTGLLGGRWQLDLAIAGRTSPGRPKAGGERAAGHELGELGEVVRAQVGDPGPEGGGIRRHRWKLGHRLM